MDEKERTLLRHFLATLAYRTNRALADASEGFGTYRAGKGIRTPHQLLRHMNDVLNFALGRVAEAPPKALPVQKTFELEQKRFFNLLQQIDDSLQKGHILKDTSAHQLLQGPLADVMTHTGQVAMLRRLFGAPIPPENFHAAAISIGNLTNDQPAPIKPHQNWKDAEGRDQVKH